ncbi:hypothetical protein AB6A40_005591 [Gnathostoma spinigerum]|uniref:Uncharacterized protein n=1 Tax=Gnathostoma spinigerum TaxID=75299 RepID=A0ABD6EI25_9BILA
MPIVLNDSKQQGFGLIGKPEMKSPIASVASNMFEFRARSDECRKIMMKIMALPITAATPTGYREYCMKR